MKNILRDRHACLDLNITQCTHALKCHSIPHIWDQPQGQKVEEGLRPWLYTLRAPGVPRSHPLLITGFLESIIRVTRLSESGKASREKPAIPARRAQWPFSIHKRAPLEWPGLLSHGNKCYLLPSQGHISSPGLLCEIHTVISTKMGKPVLEFRSEMSPKGSRVEGLVTSLWWNLQEVDLNRWKEVRSLGCALGGTLGTQRLPLFLYLLAAMRWSFFLFMLPPWRTASPPAWSNRAYWPWTETSEIMSQNKTFLLISCLSQAFCHSVRRPTNTIRMLYLLPTSTSFLFWSFFQDSAIIYLAK